MRGIQRGEECQVTDENGKCHTQAGRFYFGEGKKAELHVCQPHYDRLLEKEVEARRLK